MDYKIFNPLKTRQVEPWAEAMFNPNLKKHSQPAGCAEAVRRAVECNWFDGDKPDVDEMLPKEVIELSTKVYHAYNEAMGFDSKNLPSRRQTTPKA